jgi:signal transduction histidine kinase
MPAPPTAGVRIDALVVRGLYYAILGGLATGLYLGVTALATHVLHISRLGQPDVFSLVFMLAALVVLSRVGDRLQRLVDLILGRPTYDAQKVLSESLHQLGAACRALETSQERLVAAEKMAAFGRLVAGLAHEMNTPLGAALNGLMMARELVAECEAAAGDPTVSEADRQAVFGELAKAIASVEEWTRKAADYIRCVRAQGKTSAGPEAAFELRRLLERDLQPLLMHRLRLVGGTLELRVPPDLPELHGDPSRLGQALANLINNAIDACEGLSPERTRVVVEALRDGGDVVVHVRDRGTGIPSGDQERIFEDFYTTKPPGQGTGLGLSIARGIVAGEFGGTLACTTSDGNGTTFTIRVPVRRGRPAAGDRSKRAAA